MADSSIPLANERRLASEEKSRAVGNATHQEHYQKVAQVPVGAVPLPLQAYLADGDSSVELNVDGSSDAKSFELKPADGQVWRVERLVLVAELAGAGDWEKFGDLAALGNGLLITTRDSDDAEVVDLLGGQPVKKTSDLAAVGAAALEEGTGAPGLLRAEIAPAVPLRLDGAAGELLRITVQDNLTGLTTFRAFVAGVKEESLT